MKNQIRPLTIFCDIDGTLIKHQSPFIATCPNSKMELLAGTLDKLAEWDRLGYNIILTTGRRESMRRQTEKQLSEVGIIYDKLIMGIGGGSRVLINDKKPNSNKDTAYAISLTRDEGINNVQI